MRELATAVIMKNAYVSYIYISFFVLFCFVLFLSRIGFLEEYAKTAKANVTVLQMTLGWLLQFISCLTADQVQQHWFQKPHALEWSYARLAAVRKQLNWPAVYFSPGSVPENNAASIQSCICCSEALHYTKTKAISFRFRFKYTNAIKMAFDTSQ